MNGENMKRSGNNDRVRRGWGITSKLMLAIILSVLIALGALLGVVYVQMSDTLLEKSENLLQTTMESTQIGRASCRERV